MFYVSIRFPNRGRLCAGLTKRLQPVSDADVHLGAAGGNGPVAPQLLASATLEHRVARSQSDQGRPLAVTEAS